MREALKTIMKALQIETGIIPGDAAANLPTTEAEAEKRTTGFLSMLAERFRESAANRAPQNSLVVLPFTNLGATEVAPLYGFALADAIAARLARIPALVVRPSSTLMPLPIAQMDPLSVGQKLLVSFVLAGNFLRSENGFDLNWQLLDVASQSVRSGGAIRVASLDLIAVQTEISNEVFAALHGLRGRRAVRCAALRHARRQRQRHHCPARSAKSICRRARCSVRSWCAPARAPIWTARTRCLPASPSKDPEFAAGWSGLGIAELQYVRHGFGGQIHVMRARRAFDEALQARSGLDRGQPLPHLHAALARREGVGPPWHRQPAGRRGQRLERAHGGRPGAARRRHVRRGAGAVQPRAQAEPRQRRRSSTTTAPASTTIRTRSSWPATSWKKDWPWSRAIRCCAPRPATSRCGWAISTRPSRFWRA